MKIALALAGAVLLGTTLTACGGGDGGSGSDYCKDLKTAKTTLKDLGSDGGAGLDKAFATFHKLTKEAPSDVKSEWKTLDGAATKVEDAFKDAGIKLSDLAEIQKGNIPKDADVSKLSGLASTLSDISGPEFTKAQTAISDHAKKTCKVDLKTS